ncbi:hypothetical protein AAF712_010172 [Marasmius tenuissimus]|uniref:CxC2-like cysteine cluster KDZ transposase-associated domain-containing protein n=1 Tax=Marasmius tenuissimus TaxID=585030 RepID=A0ABR2ZMZ9_9AGAR
MAKKRTTVAHAKKIAKQKRYAAKDSDKTSSTEQTTMKMTTYFTDTGQTEVSEMDLSPSRKRQRVLHGNGEPESSTSTWAASPAEPATATLTNMGPPESTFTGLESTAAEDGWEDEPAAEGGKPKKLPQGASVVMAPLLERLEDIQNSYLAQHYDPRISEQCPCSSGDLRLFRCKQCWLGGVCCQKCLVAQHAMQPFHNVERWNGKFFEACHLGDLGAHIYLGHHGEHCPESNPDKYSWLTLVHITGIHEIFVDYCFCEGSVSHFQQLLDCRFFPGTVELPRTVFSFKLLQDFHIHTLTSKKSAHHYYNAIQRKTDPVLTHRTKGSTAIHCPACPEPGFNVSVDEILAAKPEERHKYMRFFAIDRCHSAQRLKKRDDPDDVALNAGSGYFAPRAPFHEYVSKQTGEPNNILKFKNAIVTVGMICTRHGLFQPNGIVNMDKGEGYHLADWIIYHVFLNYPGLRWLFGSYDLWCIWIKNFLKRLEKNGEFFNDKELLNLLELVVGAIPQGHIDGHGDDCKKKYHYAYTKFVAMTIGELVETPWAVEKLTGASTQHMNDGHRHDTLDDFHVFWNWLKVQKLGLFLKLKWAKAGHMLSQMVRPHKVLTLGFSCYHRMAVAQKIPSFNGRISEQMTEEKTRVASREGMDGVTDLLVTGINLDSKRGKVVYLASLKNPPKDKLKKLNTARERLLKEACSFRELLASYFPLLVPLLQSQAKEVDTGRPELSELPLPSTLSEKERDTCGLKVAGEIE